jgi:hypothetical protein
MADPQGQFTVGSPDQIPGLKEPGNIDLNNRPVIQNEDGTHSSEYSISFGTDKGEVLVPTIANGRFLTPDGKKPKPGSQAEKELFGYKDTKGIFHKGSAQKYYEKTGQHLGIFDKPEHADAYADLVHNRNKMAEPVIPQPVTSGATDNPNAPQSGVQQPPPVPEGFSDQQGPPPPPGFSDTPPEKETTTDAMADVSALQSPEVQVGMGGIKAIGQTATTVGKLMNRIPIAGKYLVPQEDINLMEQLTKQNTPLEKTGGGLEAIGEFFLGDEALKGLSIADRLDLGAKLAKFAQSNPIYGEIIKHGMNAVRGGSVATGQALAHGASPEEALKQGAIAAGLGTATGAAAEGLKAAANKVSGVVSDTLSKARAVPQDLQPEFQKGIKDLVGQVADEVGVAKSKSATIQKYVEETADNVEAKAKELYEKIDTAAGEPFIQKFQQRLSNIRRQIQGLTGTEADVTKEAALEKSRTETMEAMEEAFNTAQAKGVPRHTLDEANAMWKKAQALYDLNTEINRPSVISGLRPDIGTAAQAAANPEAVNPGSFFKRVSQMHRNGRLQEALGSDRADNFLTHVSDAQADESQLLREQAHAQANINRAKSLGVKAATGIGIGAGTLGAGALWQSLKNAP